MNTFEIDLAPGCGRKLGSRHIRLSKDKILQSGGVIEGGDWADATPLSVYKDLAISIDTSVRGANQSQDFFRLSILHAMRDLQASFYNPTDFSVSVRFNDDYINAELNDFSHSIADISRLTGARIGKIHSLLGRGPTEVTVSVVGRQVRDRPKFTSDGYNLFLVGEIHTCEIEEARDWRLLYEVGTKVLNTPQVSIAKDVSGDGLVGALVQLAEDFDMSVRVDITKVPFTCSDVPLDDCNLDRNLADFEGKIDMTMKLNRLGRATLMKPQFCGPLLVLVKQSEENVWTLPSWFSWIGICKPGGSSVEVFE